MTLLQSKADFRYMQNEKIKVTHILLLASVLTAMLFVYDAFQAFQLMSKKDFIDWVLVSPAFCLVAVFVAGELRLRVINQPMTGAEWTKPQAYIFILTPAVLLLFMGLAGPLQGTFDHVRWLFPVAGVWIGGWLYRMHLMTKNVD